MRLANKQSFVAKGITCLVFLLCISRESIAQLHYNQGDPEFTLEYCLKLFAYNGVVERKYEPIIYEQFLNSHSKSKQIRNVKRVEVVKDKIFVGQQTYDTGGYILLNENYCTTCRKYSDTLWRGYSKYTYSSDRLRVDMIERVDSIATHKLLIFNARQLIDTVIDYNPSNSGILSKLCYCYDTADRITSIWLCDSAGNRMVSNLLYYSWKNKYDLFGHVNMMYIPFGVDSAILNPPSVEIRGIHCFFLVFLIPAIRLNTPTTTTFCTAIMYFIFIKTMKQIIMAGSFAIGRKGKDLVFTNGIRKVGLIIISNIFGCMRAAYPVTP